jgi:hypothetical protein
MGVGRRIGLGLAGTRDVHLVLMLVLVRNESFTRSSTAHRASHRVIGTDKSRGRRLCHR